MSYAATIVTDADGYDDNPSCSELEARFAEAVHYREKDKPRRTPACNSKEQSANLGTWWGSMHGIHISISSHTPRSDLFLDVLSFGACP